MYNAQPSNVYWKVGKKIGLSTAQLSEALTMTCFVLEVHKTGDREDIHGGLWKHVHWEYIYVKHQSRPVGLTLPGDAHSIADEVNDRPQVTTPDLF